MKKKFLIVSVGTLISLILLMNSLNISSQINDTSIAPSNLKLFSNNSPNNFLSNSPISGLIDVNTPSENFNLISSGFSSNNWTLNGNFKDNNPNIDINSVFSSTNFVNPNLSILIASNVNANYSQNFPGFKAFDMNSSLITPFLFANIALNNSYNVAFLFQHAGFSIYSNKDLKVYNGLTIVPELIKNKFKETFFPELQESKVSYEINSEKFQITYENVIFFWQELPPDLKIELDPFLPESTILPLTYGLNIMYITLFDSVSFEYVIIKNKESGITSIENKVTIGELNKLVVNETLPLDITWNHSEQINSNQIEIDFDGWPAQHINFPAVSVYSKEEVGKRIKLPGNELFLYASESLGDFSYFNNLENSIKLNVLIDEKKSINHSNQGEFNKKIQYQLETLNRVKNSIQNYDILNYDRENYNLVVKDNLLFESQMNLYNSTFRDQKLLSVYSKYIELYYDLLNNYSTANNFLIPFDLYNSLNTNYLLKTNLSFWDGSKLEYYHGLKLTYLEVNFNNNTAIETAEYKLFGISFMLATVLSIIWKRKFE
ncbi:MAG: hypothetical protein HeimC3_43030 [Candidatus Heimdallarchaeota archaeon LC_3]|nr:MAG: hypothetical protein HeimC3_43030 [Candidatus Heimdallarchaeota archaeon LC_3]